jgi:hypothetical protein
MDLKNTKPVNCLTSVVIPSISGYAEGLKQEISNKEKRTFPEKSENHKLGLFSGICESESRQDLSGNGRAMGR